MKKVKFSEASGGGSSAVSLKAPDALSADVDFVLPAADGSNGQCIVTDGSGALSFADNSSVSLSAANSWTGVQTFDQVIRKRHIIDEHTAHDETNANSPHQLTSSDVGKMVVWNPGSAPTGNNKWKLPDSIAVGSQIMVINCNSHGNDKIHVYPSTDASLYRKGQSGNLTYAGVEQWEQHIFYKATSDKWILSPHV